MLRKLEGELQNFAYINSFMTEVCIIPWSVTSPLREFRHKRDLILHLKFLHSKSIKINHLNQLISSS